MVLPSPTQPILSASLLRPLATTTPPPYRHPTPAHPPVTAPSLALAQLGQNRVRLGFRLTPTTVDINLATRPTSDLSLARAQALGRGLGFCVFAWGTRTTPSRRPHRTLRLSLSRLPLPSSSPSSRVRGSTARVRVLGVFGDERGIEGSGESGGRQGFRVSRAARPPPLLTIFIFFIFLLFYFGNTRGKQPRLISVAPGVEQLK
jgi:hypothetical protein